jgi:hypothetical protein
MTTEKNNTPEKKEGAKKGAYIVLKNFGYAGFTAMRGDVINIPENVVKALGGRKDDKGKEIFFKKA